MTSYSHRYSYVGLGANSIAELRRVAVKLLGHFYRDLVVDHKEKR